MAFYDHDSLDYQDYVSFSSYESHVLDSYGTHIVSEFQEPSGDYDYGYGYVGSNSYSCPNPDINYFAYKYIEPELITYEPASCDMGYISYHTKYSVSYSKMDSGFNEPEFLEYDPTPYGGGYDIISVYGKPLPPSDKTCYPLSNVKRIEPTSTPTPLIEAKLEPEHELVSRPEPQVVHVPVPVVMPQPIPDPTPVSLIEPEGPELEESGEREMDEYKYPNYGYDYPWPEYDNGNRNGVGYDYGYGKQVVQIPPFEYDPDVVDLCENIFGNWPCLSKIRNRNQQMSIGNKARITCPENGHRNPLEECASYIFGRPIASYNQYPP